MSYDLSFVQRAGTSAPTHAEITQFLSGSEKHFEYSDGSAVYENPNTDVHFVVDLGKGGEPPATLLLNFMRPSIFALEAAEFGERLANRFSFDVVDGQAGSRGAFDAARFIQNWTASNARICRTMGGDKAPTLLRATLEEHWRWNRYVERHERIIDNMFAARVMYRSDDGVVRAIAAVTENNPTIVPVVDDVVLVGSLKRKFPWSKPATGVAVHPMTSLAGYAASSLETREGHKCAYFADVKELFAAKFVHPWVAADFGKGLNVAEILDREFVTAS